jgi:large subunit ribosomal protein L7e
MEDKDLIYGENGLIYKAQTILRHKNRLSEKAEQKARQKIESFTIQRSKLKIPKSEVVKPEDFVNNYRERQKNYSYYKLRKVSPREADLPDEAEVVLVLRILGNKNVSEQQTRILRKLGLRKAHEARLFRADADLRKCLKLVENFVIYGPIDRRTVKELISKRGQLRVNDELKLISSNQVVEDVLGKLGVVCVEDIVGEITGNSEHFGEIQKSLA